MPINKGLSLTLAGATLAMVAAFALTRLPDRPQAHALRRSQPARVACIRAPLRSPIPAHAPDPALSRAAGGMEAEHIFVYDSTGGQLLYTSSAADSPVYPASITKLFSAWVALQWLPPETEVTLGNELTLVQPGSSLAYLAQGQRLTAGMLAEAMLLPSGNDAAYALAAAAGRQIAGDPALTAYGAVEVFVEELNRQAQGLGLNHTHFENPDGYHHPAHLSCPEDLARMGAIALSRPLIRQYSAMASHAVTFASGETITWYNTNRLANPGDSLYEPLFLGGKTGYTSQAGCCLLAAFRAGEREVIIGIFGAGDRLSRYQDAKTLLSVLLEQAAPADGGV